MATRELGAETVGSSLVVNDRELLQSCARHCEPVGPGPVPSPPPTRIDVSKLENLP
jgi:hypothetical protein